MFKYLYINQLLLLFEIRLNKKNLYTTGALPLNFKLVLLSLSLSLFSYRTPNNNNKKRRMNIIDEKFVVVGRSSYFRISSLREREREQNKN